MGIFIICKAHGIEQQAGPKHTAFRGFPVNVLISRIKCCAFVYEEKPKIYIYL